VNPLVDATDEIMRHRLRSAAHILLPIVLIVVGSLLRFHNLNAHGLWLDEASSVLFARTTTFWRIMWRQEGNMLFYYLLLREWVRVGDTEFWVRIPSVFFAVASISMIYFLGRDLFSKTTGIIAAALITVHSFHIFFSQEARGYTLLVFLLLV
jgi:uncharacterized membrane protein